MVTVNHNYLKLPGSYLFSTIGKKVKAYKEANPQANVISLGIGDVTQPLAPAIIEALHKSVDEMGDAATFHGYAPDLGYEFLRSAIAKNDYKDRGCDIEADEINALFDKLEKLQSGDFLVLAGSIPNSLPNDIYEEILAKLQNKGINFAVDATGDLLLNVLKYKPFLIKPNHHELGDIFGVEVKNEYEIAHYARKLQEMGARNVLVSRSKDGATLIDENGEVHSMGNVPGKVINPVGCGDSMVAGFVAGYSKTHDYKYALKLGSACGNATAFCSGLADKATIDLMLKSEYLK